MSLLRTGSSAKYSANWSKAFGTKKASESTASSKASAPKAKAKAATKTTGTKKKSK